MPANTKYQVFDRFSPYTHSLPCRGGSGTRRQHSKSRNEKNVIFSTQFVRIDTNEKYPRFNYDFGAKHTGPKTEKKKTIDKRDKLRLFAHGTTGSTRFIFPLFHLGASLWFSNFKWIAFWGEMCVCVHRCWAWARESIKQLAMAAMSWDEATMYYWLLFDYRLLTIRYRFNRSSPSDFLLSFNRHSFIARFKCDDESGICSGWRQLKGRRAVPSMLNELRRLPRHFHSRVLPICNF